MAEKFIVLKDMAHYGVQMLEGEVWKWDKYSGVLSEIVDHSDFVSRAEFEEVNEMVRKGEIVVTESSFENCYGYLTVDYKDEFKKGDRLVWGRIEEGRLRPNLRLERRKPKTIFGLSVYSLPKGSYEVLDES